MKRLLLILIILSSNLSAFGSSPITNSVDISKLSLNPSKKMNRVFTGGDVGITFGDYTEIRISPLIGYRFSPEIFGGSKFVYRHSWDKVNQGTSNETTIQRNDFGGNVFLQYNPIKEFYLKSEFSYQSYKSSTTQNTSEKIWVPFLFLGGGYTKYLSSNVFFNAGIKVDVLNDKNSPFDDFSPFFDVGIGVDI